MNFAQRILLMSPVLLLGGLSTGSDVQAVELTGVGDPLFHQEHIYSRATLPTSGHLSSDPLIPRGCACSRCTQSSPILQGQFPAF